MNAHGLSSIGMAAQMVDAAIGELQVTVDNQFVKQHYHRWKDSSVKLSRLQRIRRELLQELEPDGTPPTLLCYRPRPQTQEPSGRHDAERRARASSEDLVEAGASNSHRVEDELQQAARGAQQPSEHRRSVATKGLPPAVAAATCARRGHGAAIYLIGAARVGGRARTLR